MNRLTPQQLIEAWEYPQRHDDPGHDLMQRLESVQDAIRAAHGDTVGYWNVVREMRSAYLESQRAHTLGES